MVVACDRGTLPDGRGELLRDSVSATGVTTFLTLVLGSRCSGTTNGSVLHTMTINSSRAKANGITGKLDSLRGGSDQGPVTCVMTLLWCCADGPAAADAERALGGPVGHLALGLRQQRQRLPAEGYGAPLGMTTLGHGKG
jgi:hypothetical protein